MEVKQNKLDDLSNKVLFIGSQAIYSWKNKKKKAKLTAVTVEEEHDFIYFKDLDFDLTFLFELQQNYTQAIVEIFNEIYTDFCLFMNKKKIINLNKSKKINKI